MKDSSKEKKKVVLVKSNFKKESVFKRNIHITLRCVALALGIAVVVLSKLNNLDPNSSVAMLGIGLTCLAISILEDKTIM